MTDKEIRALIERRRKDWRYGNSVEAKYKAEECDDILELMDEQEEPVSIWHDASEPPIIDKTFLLVAPNGNSSLCLWGGKELHSVTIGGGHSVLCRGDIYSYIDDLLNLDNSCNFVKTLQEEPVSKVWHDAQIDPPQAKKKILAINEYGDCEVDYAINMALYWPKVIKWAYIEDLLNLSNVQRTVKICKEPVSEDLK